MNKSCVGLVSSKSNCNVQPNKLTLNSTNQAKSGSILNNYKASKLNSFIGGVSYSKSSGDLNSISGNVSSSAASSTTIVNATSSAAIAAASTVTAAASISAANHLIINNNTQRTSTENNTLNSNQNNNKAFKIPKSTSSFTIKTNQYMDHQQNQLSKKCKIKLYHI